MRKIEYISLHLAREVEAAAERIQAFVKPTPVLFSSTLSARSGLSVYLKLENTHPTGSFKLRGAFSKLTWLREKCPDALVVTASTGNHALAMACALNALAMRGRIFVPQRVSAAKFEKLKASDGHCVQIDKIDAAPEQVERHARQWAESRGGVYVSPYNDLQVLAGQGTLAMELLRQLPDLNGVYAAVGGGGLIAGMAGYLKCQSPEVSVTACQPENDAAMYASVNAGKIVDIKAQTTLSDGTAGGVDADSMTLAPCQYLVDQWRLVSETQIGQAMKLLYQAPEWDEKNLFEGAAGVAIAGFLSDAQQRRQSTEGSANALAEEKIVVLVICGGNIEPHRFRQVLENS